MYLKALRTKSGKFASYNDKVELVRIINCAGCPGILEADKLAGRIRALAELDVDAIHFSNCVIHYCPFKEEYRYRTGKDHCMFRWIVKESNKQ